MLPDCLKLPRDWNTAVLTAPPLAAAPGLAVSQALHLLAALSFRNMHVSQLQPAGCANASRGLTAAAGLAVAHAAHFARSLGLESMQVSQAHVLVFLNLRRGLSIVERVAVGRFSAVLPAQ